MMIFAEARGSTDEKKKTNFFCLETKQRKKNNKDFCNNMCALCVCVYRGIFVHRQMTLYYNGKKRLVFV